LRAELPLPQLEAPFLFTDGIGPGELDRLAATLAGAVRRLPDDEPWDVHAQHPKGARGAGAADPGGEVTS
jgi:hypothetical protein